MAALRFASALCYSALVFCAQASDDFLTKSEPSVGLGAELELILGHSFSSQFDKLKEQIHPMFLSLPKRSGSLLNPATARYALHRFNMDQHGRSINGIQSTKDAFNSSHLTVTDILSGLLPEHVLTIFEKHTMQDDGISLDEVTMMASTIEYFVHEDQKGILRTVSEAMDLPTVGPMRDEDMRSTIKTYLSVFLGFVSVEELKKHKNFKWFFGEAAYYYPGWEDATLLVDDETDALLTREKDIRNPFRASESSMEVAMRVVEILADQLSTKHWELECQQIKSDLLEHDDAITGRLRLADFYRAGLTSKYFYVETKEYLRAVGALDDTDIAVGPKVLIPNLVQAESNCLAEGHIYSICCMDECEGLYGYLEKEIASSEAPPELIVSLVSGLPSSTIPAPRNLSAALVMRLNEIATAHGGKVLVHSRLFAQWMHQAFPAECKYPHLAGTTTLLTPDDWEKATGLESRIDHAGKASRRNATLHHIEALDGQFTANKSNELDAQHVAMEVAEPAEGMWSSDDEHLVAPQASPVKSLLRSWTFLAFSFFIGVGLILSKKKEGKLKVESAQYDSRAFTV